MSSLSDWVSQYCSSEHFALLDSNTKAEAEPLLSVWCETVGQLPSVEGMEAALRKVAQLDLPLGSRKAFPALLSAFLEYVSSTGNAPHSARWLSYLPEVEDRYEQGFREDGSVRGQTVRKSYETVGRNDPCPCGSGRKFKKCCIDVLS